MKKILRFLSIAAIMFSCVFSFTACGGDDDSDDGGNTDGDIVINGNNGGSNSGDSLNINQTKLLKSVGNLLFSYNEKGSLASIQSEYDGKVEVSYNPLILKYTYEYGYDNDYYYEQVKDEITVSNIKINSNGYITSCSFASLYSYKDGYGTSEEKTNGSLTFQYNGNNLTKITLIGHGSEYEEEDGEKFNLYFDVNRNATLSWSNGNLQNIIVTNSTTAGNYGYYKLNCTVNFKYGNKQNKTAQYTHAFAEYLSNFFLEDEFTGLCYMNLLGEPSIDFPTSAYVTQKDEESYIDYEYNSTLEATETYSNYHTDEDEYLLSYDTERVYSYSKPDDEYGSSGNYSYTTYYSYTDNSDVTPDFAPAKKSSKKSLKERKTKGFFNKRK